MLSILAVFTRRPILSAVITVSLFALFLLTLSRYRVADHDVLVDSSEEEALQLRMASRKQASRQNQIQLSDLPTIDVNRNRKLKTIEQVPQQPMPQVRYEASWESLDTRPLPSWYDDVKFGIFLHWGVYSYVGMLSEWFEFNWRGEVLDKRNAVDKEEAVEFMKKNFKPGFKYAEFAPQFTAEFYDPIQWAKLFSDSGAKYVVLTSKHHDGYTLWPSKYSRNWNSVAVGPGRDLIGELASAIRETTPDIHFGLYYSLYEWFHPLYLSDKENGFKSTEYVQLKLRPEMLSLVETYKPEIVWSDGDWEASDAYWNSTGFLSWLYSESPVKDVVLTNDRWGIDSNCAHGGYFTCKDRFSPGILQKHKWENCMTIDRLSWGFRRTMSMAEVSTPENLVKTLIETVSCGGNLLLNVGPTHSGRIPPIFEERLQQVGAWLKLNGEAIYSTKPWIFQNDTLTPGVWFTSKVKSAQGLNPVRLFNPQTEENTIVYATVLKWPKEGKLLLGCLKSTSKTTVSLLGYSGTIGFKQKENALEIALTSIGFQQLSLNTAWTLKFEYLATSSRLPDVYLASRKGHEKVKFTKVSAE